MRLRLFALLICFALVGGVASAQTTGEIYGKVTDTTGAMIAGVTVTISSPVLLSNRNPQDQEAR